MKGIQRNNLPGSPVKCFGMYRIYMFLKIVPDKCTAVIVTIRNPFVNQVTIIDGYKFFQNQGIGIQPIRDNQLYIISTSIIVCPFRILIIGVDGSIIIKIPLP